jgi:outer membrane murein-binding lipoprotein Lpp
MKKLVLVAVVLLVVLLSSCTADEVKTENAKETYSINPERIKVPTHG